MSAATQVQVSESVLGRKKWYQNTSTPFITSVYLVPQVDGDEETTAVPDSERSCKGEDITINLQPSNAYEFSQALNAARCSANTKACADLLASTSPEMLPQFLSNQLDGHSVSFIMQALDSHLLEKDPNLVYQHLNHMHTADRFSVRKALQIVSTI